MMSWVMWLLVLSLLFAKDVQCFRFPLVRHESAIFPRKAVTNKSTPPVESTPLSSSSSSSSSQSSLGGVVIKDLQFVDIFALLRLTTEEFFPTCPTLVDKKNMLGNILG